MVCVHTNFIHLPKKKKKKFSKSFEKHFPNSEPHHKCLYVPYMDLKNSQCEQHKSRSLFDSRSVPTPCQLYSFGKRSLNLCRKDYMEIADKLVLIFTYHPCQKDLLMCQCMLWQGSQQDIFKGFMVNLQALIHSVVNN